MDETKIVTKETILLEAIREIRYNAQNILDGGLQHFSRRDCARAIRDTCDCALAKVVAAMPAGYPFSDEQVEIDAANDPDRL